MNIYVVRHGETEENIKGTYCGALDVALTEKGVRQAELLGEKLKDIKFSKVYVSPTIRTYATLKAIIKDSCKAIEDSRIKEINFGAFEGKTYDYISKNYKKQCEIWQEDWCGFAPPEGESYEQMYKRTCSFIEDLKKDMDNNANKDDNILIVTHGGVLRAFYAYVLGNNIDIFWKISSKNCDYAVIKYEYGNMFIDSICHYNS